MEPKNGPKLKAKIEAFLGAIFDRFWAGPVWPGGMRGAIRTRPGGAQLRVRLALWFHPVE